MYSFFSEIIQHNISTVETEEIPSISQDTRSVTFTPAPELAETSEQEHENLVPEFKMDLLGNNNTDATLGSPVHNLTVKGGLPFFLTTYPRNPRRPY